MSRDDWFRNTTWDSNIEEAFFEKLSRARTQRDQYLAIQATTIAPYQPQAALRLVERYFDTRKDDFHDVQAFWAKVHAYRKLGNSVATVTAYKQILAREAEFPRHKTNAYVGFPYFVARERLEGEYEYAIKVLEDRIGDIRFPIDRFMWHASFALISSELGNESVAKEHAKQAVAAAEARKTGFRYHQNLGLVGKEHKPVVKTLVNLAVD